MGAQFPFIFPLFLLFRLSLPSPPFFLFFSLFFSPLPFFPFHTLFPLLSPPPFSHPFFSPFFLTFIFSPLFSHPFFSPFFSPFFAPFFTFFFPFFLPLFFWEGLASYTEIESRGVATQPAQFGRSLLLEEVNKIGHGPINARESKRLAARDGEHPRPPPSPTENADRRRVGRPLLVVQPSFQQTQLFLGSIVPRSPWPQPQDDTCHLRGALHTSILCPRSRAHNAIHSGGPWARRPRGSQGTPQSGQLPTELRERAEGRMPELPQLFRHWHGRRHSCQPIWHCNGLKHLLPCRFWPMCVLVPALSSRVWTRCGGGPWNPRAPHSHLASVTGSGTLKRSKILNSGLVGQPCNKCEQPLPE